MKCLNPRDGLVRYHKHSLQREPASTFVETVFQRGTEKLDGHCIVIVFSAPSEKSGDALLALDLSENARLVQELLASCSDVLQFHGQFFVGLQVDCFVDVSEASIAHFA